MKLFTFLKAFLLTFYNLPEVGGIFALAALELPVKRQLEQRLCPGVRHEEQRHSEHWSFPLT